MIIHKSKLKSYIINICIFLSLIKSYSVLPLVLLLNNKKLRRLEVIEYMYFFIFIFLIYLNLIYGNQFNNEPSDNFNSKYIYMFVIFSFLLIVHKVSNEVFNKFVITYIYSLFLFISIGLIFTLINNPSIIFIERKFMLPLLQERFVTTGPLNALGIMLIISLTFLETKRIIFLIIFAFILSVLLQNRTLILILMILLLLILYFRFKKSTLIYYCSFFVLSIIFSILFIPEEFFDKLFQVLFLDFEKKV